MIKWKAAVYLRLSVDDGQKAESNSISNQKELINSYIKKEKDIKVIDYYVDDGYTGTSFDRPGFQRLLLDMKDNKINTVIVKDLSRLGRNYVEVGNYMEQIFPLYKIRFIAINDNIDSFKEPKSADNIIVPIKNLMNDEYARDISNKVRSTLNTKKEKGEFIGSVAPYGYLKDPNNKYKFVIDPYASKIVKKIFCMILKGKSKYETIDYLNKLNVLPPRLYQLRNTTYKFKITEEMKKWNRKKLDKILTNKCYIGYLIQSKKKTISHKVHKIIDIDPIDWIIIHNHHEAIVNKEDFYRAQEILYSRDIKIDKNKKYDIFSGRLKCSDCGNSFTRKKIKKYEYYYCTSFLLNKKCTNHSIRKDKLIDVILNVINNQVNLVLELNNKLKEIIDYGDVNYDYEILYDRLKTIETNISKYSELKTSIKQDLSLKYISRDEYNEYNNQYDEVLLKNYEDRDFIIQELKSVKFNSCKNKEWINVFIEKCNLNKLTKAMVDELIENIIIDNNGNIKVIFKYEDEYNEALDFINEHKCDIICKELEAKENEKNGILMLNIV